MPRTFSIKEDIVWTEISVNQSIALSKSLLSAMRGFSICDKSTEKVLILLFSDDTENDLKVIQELKERMISEGFTEIPVESNRNGEIPFSGNSGSHVRVE